MQTGFMAGVRASVAVLAVANVLNNRLLPRAYVPTSVVASATLLTLARRHGLSWEDLGLGRRTGGRGLVSAAGSVAAVGAVYATAAALPGTRTAFVDRRARRSLGGVAYQALVPVLFGTVLLEEVGFRGVLWGLLNRRQGPVVATTGSSVLFGLWHILPSRDMGRHNQAVGRAFGTGPGSRSAVAASAVAVTAAAGVVLAELRRRSGSLIAPAGLHWATNGLGYVVSYLSGSKGLESCPVTVTVPKDADNRSRTRAQWDERQCRRRVLLGGNHHASPAPPLVRPSRRRAPGEPRRL